MHLDTMDTESPAPFTEAVAASAEVDANRIEVLRPETHILDIPMTDEERLAKGDELAEVHATIAKLEGDIEAETARHKQAKGQLAAERDTQLAQAKHLARSIRDRIVSKDVECRVEKVFATGMVRTVRIDTGETIEERAMEADERNADLFAPTPSDAPESFSELHEDEPSEPPQAITVEGEVIETGLNHVPMWHFVFTLRNLGTRVRCQLSEPEAIDTCNESLNVGDHVELVGHYGGEGGEEIATFIASELRVLDPETEIDATKMATLGDVVEAKKANGERGRKS